MTKSKKHLSPEQTANLLSILQSRFEKNMQRHKNILWANVAAKLLNHPDKLYTIYQMEETGGEPDVITFESNKNDICFCDCAAESPKQRRSLCYDNAALLTRKEHKPKNSAVQMAEEIGIELLTEEQYRALQQLQDVDLITSSWIHTPEHIRKLGGALFCDRRYNSVFTYHNGAESYYSSRGFRGLLKI